MKTILAIATLMLGSLSLQAQEKVMNVLKKDGTTAQTRVEELKQISFLATQAGENGLLITTWGGEKLGFKFEANPVVAIAKGKMTITSNEMENALEVEVSEIAEIEFGDTSDATGIEGIKVFDCLMQRDGMLLSRIPEGAKVSLYTLDGKRLPAPQVKDGHLLFNRATLGSGIFIVKVGTLSTKIKL